MYQWQIGDYVGLGALILFMVVFYWGVASACASDAKARLAWNSPKDLSGGDPKVCEECRGDHKAHSFHQECLCERAIKDRRLRISIANNKRGI